MNIQEQKKLSPPGREKNHICNKCGWAYPNPHPSAKHRRAHKKICGKPLGFKPVDSSDDRGLSDDEQQQNPSDDERQTLQDELFDDAVTEFSPVDSEKSVKRTEDSSPLLNVDANSDSAPSPGTKGSFMGLNDSDKVVERAVEIDLESSPLLKVDTSSDSMDKPDMGAVEDDTEGTKKMDKDDLDEVPEQLTRNLSESFETEIKSLETDEKSSLSREDGVARSEQEQGGGSQLKMSDIPLEGEPNHLNNGDSKVSANTNAEGEAVKHNVCLTLDSAEVISPLGDGDKVNSRNMNFQEDSVSSGHIEKHNRALDTDNVHVLSAAEELPVVEDINDDLKDDEVLNSDDMIKTHPDSLNCPDEDTQELVNETKIDNGNEIVEPVGSVAMERDESVDRVNAQVSDAPIVEGQKSPDDSDVLDCISPVEKDEKIEEPILKESSSEPSILSHAAVEDTQNKEFDQVAFALESMQEKGKDGPIKDHHEADLSSQNSLEANWGSASVISTQSEARASVDADTLRSSPQESAKPEEEATFNKSGNAASDAFEPPLSVVERGGGQLDQNDTFFKSEAEAQKPESLKEERTKTEEAVMAKVTNWSTEKHESTPLKSLLGEANNESQQKSTVKSVLRDEAPLANQTMNRNAAAVKEWNSPAGNKKKVKGKPSWIPFVCCSSVNVS